MNSKPLTDEDGEVRELTAADFAAMRPAAEVVPEVVAAYKRSRGRPSQEKTKISTTIRLDPEVLAYFRSAGQGWQTRINEALQAYVTDQKKQSQT
jgi:uncharacterized protein (DUF4415 family)